MICPNQHEMTAIVTRDGKPLWRCVELGPRGGRRHMYAERRDGDAAPTGYELWSYRQRDAGGYCSSATIFPAHGLYY